MYRANLMLCGGTGCIAGGSLKIKDALIEELKKHKLQDEISVVLTGCNGFCAQGPLLIIHPEDTFYEKLKPEDIPFLIEEHFIKGRPVEKFMYREPKKRSAVPSINEIPFFKFQVLRALRNKGLVDPESIDEYIARDGYMAAGKVLLEMTPEQVIKEVKDSGIRGRGGAGFPTGLKWEFCSRAKGDQKYILCNGDEGDPGAFMDRSIMEADPHVVLEGMIIAAKAIGASKGYIYVRAEYPLAVSRLQIAIDQAKEYGLIGEDILNSGFNLDIEIYLGAGAFVCGEETALMRSLEGKRGMPIPRPPFPVNKGLWGKPTVLNNVETYANIPQIILNGAEWFKSLGTEKSTGTKVFALTGAVNNIGLIEVPMGTPLRTIIFDIGGGIRKGRKFKAVQLGGPSGGCVPEHLLETPVTYEDIVKTGAIVGSGGMVVMDDNNCMVNVARFFLEFTADESCGKCTPCRIGTRVMLDRLIDITEGRGKEEDIEILQDLSGDIIKTSLCGLGQTAPNPVLTTIRYFKDEYESHIHDNWCKAGVCRELSTFYIDEEACTGCTVCARNCPQHAITGEKKKPHHIHQELCIKCRTCYEKCKFGAVKVGPRDMFEKEQTGASVEG
ncbi:NADP-reducing hydrogenase subunit HndC [bacterium BMS3Bbin06]|nr:NADP-reducing hydrogenase subunit HndC [bacterium BMS3Abin08]GBE35699.1 NADP-reducing hydrogenase subunit HndC [bacterium BMS3Bbin06]HDY72034.1 NADH-quinone oxidoreductase subunit NuoF [Nitrospirota bacterium]